jgi:hypothetical protein
MKVEVPNERPVFLITYLNVVEPIDEFHPVLAMTGAINSR